MHPKYFNLNIKIPPSPSSSSLLRNIPLFPKWKSVDPFPSGFLGVGFQEADK